MKSSKHLKNALKSTGCIEEKLKTAVAAWKTDIGRFASSYELKEVDYELRSTLRQREHQLHSSIISQGHELTCLLIDLKSELDMIKFNKNLRNTILLQCVVPIIIMVPILAWIDSVK
ncbi:hypothetical protein HX866_33125 [Pseudomonas gingeri]|uniref:hypothetical protein n=1 Tax=Pseudomonas gingeri TaxID=117681 RepID=UPI0015A43BCD|nr:hypothetical protein [Pseudomonas gingeri]NWA29728.1 hypothetical protein [Pseudomonas gingeri]